MPRRRDYRAYWFGICRCFFCALWYNGTTFQRWAVLTQLLLMILIPASVFLPWIQISYKTGNHLERMRPTFAFIDGNGNNKLEYDELSHFFKDMQQIQSLLVLWQATTGLLWWRAPSFFTGPVF